MTLRYPMRIGGELHPAGTPVENVPLDALALRAFFPGVRMNQTSPYACIRIPGEDTMIVGEFKTIGNVPWLVSMALAVATAKESCSMFEIQERS